MKMSLKICALLPLIALAACGKVGDLEPRAGSKPVPVAYGKDKPAAAEELTTASAQARPGRSVELLRRSQRREDDPFDLPPGGAPEAEVSAEPKTMDEITDKTPEPSPKAR